MASGIGARMRARLARGVRRARLLASLRHIHGPRQLQRGPDDVTVIALVRDGAYYLDEFLRHYRALGARHFVFIDNGSTDDTVTRLRAQPDTVIVQSLLPWGPFENALRNHAARRYGAGGWVLYADMDELFDFDGSARIGLAGLVRYLSAHGYSVLVAQMLEMFSDRPLRETAQMPYAQAIAEYRYCDTGSITALPYHDPSIPFAWYLRHNTVADPAIRFLFGGVRARVFGENCCLTKHPLVHVGAGVQPGVHPHCSAHVACADFTALIRHYKFTNDAFARDAATVARAAIPHGEDRARLAIQRARPDLSLFSDSARRLDGFEQLYRDGFLVRSPRFADHVARHG